VLSWSPTLWPAAVPALLTLALLGQAAPPEGAPPEPPPDPTGGVEIVSVRIGPDPASSPPRRGGSFITNSSTLLEIVAEARVPQAPQAEAEIEWHVSPPAGFSAEAEGTLRGPRLTARFKRAGGNPNGGGGSLVVSIRAAATLDGRALEQRLNFVQDATDRLRQEYVDLRRSAVPARGDLLTREAFRARFGRRYAAVRFDELNSSWDPATGNPYPVILASEQLVRALADTRRAYGNPLRVAAGFRNPVKPHTGPPDPGAERHEAGRAADLTVPPNSTEPRDGRGSPSPADWLRLAGAAAGSGAWVAPLADSGPGLVHLDLRAGVRTRLVRVRGQVTDPGGNPVGGATVRLAGMAAVTNPEGRYELKHVLAAGTLDLEIETPGRGKVTQSLYIGGLDVTEVSVRVPADPNPTLVARAEPAVRDATGTATLQVVLKNAGLAEARAVRLSAAAVDPAAAAVLEVSSGEVPHIGSGIESAFSVRLGLQQQGAASYESLAIPLRLTANYSSPKGTPISQVLQVVVTLAPPTITAATPAAGATPGGAAPAPGVIHPQARGGFDFGALAGGLLFGAIAGAITAQLARHAAAQMPERFEEEPSPPDRPSGQDVLHDPGLGHVGQALVAGVVVEGEAAEVQPQQVEYGGVEVGDVDHIGDGPIGEVVGGAVGDAAPDPAPGDPEAEGPLVVVPPVLAFGEGGAAELARPDDQRVIEETAQPEVPQEPGHGEVRAPAE
jgi:hypothetical protein